MGSENKRILIYDYKHYGVLDIRESFEKKGFQIDLFSQPLKDNLKDDEFGQALDKAIEDCKALFVFSFNFYPIISNVCKRKGIPYVCWVYDSPLISLYSYTVINDNNYIFLFDSEQYNDLRGKGISTVYYLPLAANVGRLNQYSSVEQKYISDISFLGSMYDEEKHALYKRLYDGLNEYGRGYLDGVIQIQKNVYGTSVLESAITPEILQIMQNALNVTTNPDGVESPAYTYANYFLARRVTELERREIAERLGKLGTFKLYTGNLSLRIPGVENMGPVDYYNEMPFVFKNSKINLNITLRSIISGIPLRIFDIMGCGGFVLTNYQQDMFEYFIPEEDFVFYSDMEELSAKCKFYLEHDDIRKKIAQNGYAKVKEHHTFDARVEEILNTIKI